MNENDHQYSKHVVVQVSSFARWRHNFPKLI